VKEQGLTKAKVGETTAVKGYSGGFCYSGNVSCFHCDSDYTSIKREAWKSEKSYLACS
jgi:hypothetical protein